VDQTGTFASQIHDYDPGIAASGLFWTIAIPDDSVEADLEDAEARLHLSNLSIHDYGSIPNGLFHFAPPQPGKVSLDLRWFDALKRGTTSDPTKPFEQNYVQTKAHISWSGQTGRDEHFQTTGGQQTVHFAQIAQERNGSFFGSDEDDD
jgi:hypothetical protein